ncbi:ATP/GTP-binding protein [Leucobacter sp. UCMA 4100]|uniref:ATP/GTP-binding protein n=1 Tax=Leucobacter sp. UCMA 4100 TaxID=2810534 RepID=UPI0022EA754F|nr:ATP/GTP-binding protein [Leucobacter sp. UCMA 4100]MDA3145995.1 ATP/GTP-binding protein [Leucobacter sp. UCMA 4100]
MARKNRRRPVTPKHDVERLSYGGASKVVKRGREWFVREVPAHRAEKEYRCPDCGQVIARGQAHVVAWSAEHIFGDGAAVTERRHWHAHCWRIAS